MSSADETPIPAFKKRKLQRACDYCRRKKTKCDGPEMPNNRCSNCMERRAECTYVQGPNNHRYTRKYVDDLEGRLERMEKVISKLVPDTDVAKEIDTQHPNVYPNQSLGMPSERAHTSASRAGEPPHTSLFTIPPPSPASPDNGVPSEDEEAELDEDLTEAMRKLSMRSQPSRYHGKSSGLVFIRSALALKQSTGSRPDLNKDGRHPWLKSFVEDDFPVFEESAFPPPDLLDSLVDLYFCHMNIHFPLLHEPTFKAAVKAGQHLRDGGFGATVLLACAIGARSTHDPRVLLPGSGHPHTAGWAWFGRVEQARRLSFAPAKLHDLQVYALMALFLYGSNAPGGPWAVVGAGVRAALEVGVHRKRMYSPTPNVQEELWRRAFWILVLLEWMMGYSFGRPCSIHDEDFDLALPSECDDEYWLTPEGEPLFKQPPGEPSKVSGFVQLLKLGQILAFANRTIYATNKSRAQLGHSDQQWEQRVVAELDSALNKWSDSLPSHLRWNPEQENVLFLNQAATIAAFYYLHQIAVHRSFMSRSSSRRDSPISPLSTIICVNAARSTIQVIEVVFNRTGNPTHRNMGMMFAAALVLMTNILGLKRSGKAVNMEKDLALVGKCIEMLRSLRYQMHISETLADVLTNLMTGATDSPAPGASSNIQEGGAASSQAEREHAPSREQRTEGPNPAAHPAHMHLDLESTLPATFTTLFRSDVFEQGFATPVGGPIPRDATEDGHPPPAASHAMNLNSFLPAQLVDLPPSQPHDATLVDAIEGAAQGPFGMDTGRMFGLDAIGTTGSIPWLPPAASQTVPQGHPQDPNHGHLGTVDTPLEEQDSGMSDLFMLMDDTLAMWPNMPPIFGWDEWGGHSAGANGTGT